jgi:hypothetical protein
MVIENFKIHENAIEGFGEWNGTESFIWNSKWFSVRMRASLETQNDSVSESFTRWCELSETVSGKNANWVKRWVEKRRLKRRLKLRKASSGDWNDDWFELITEWNADWNWETIRNDVIVSWEWRDDTNWEWRDGAIEWRLRMEEWREDAIEWRSWMELRVSVFMVCVRTLNELQNIKWEIF